MTDTPNPTKLSSEVQDVDRCVKCGHGSVDHTGRCQGYVDGTYVAGIGVRCDCKCVFPSTSVSAKWKHHKNCAIWTVTTDGAEKACDCAQVDSVFKGSPLVSEVAAPSSAEFRAMLAEADNEITRLRQVVGWVLDAADAAYIEDENNKRIHEIFNIAAKAGGLTRRLPDENHPLEL